MNGRVSARNNTRRWQRARDLRGVETPVGDPSVDHRHRAAFRQLAAVDAGSSGQPIAAAGSARRISCPTNPLRPRGHLTGAGSCPRLTTRRPSGSTPTVNHAYGSGSRGCGARRLTASPPAAARRLPPRRPSMRRYRPADPIPNAPKPTPNTQVSGLDMAKQHAPGRWDSDQHQHDRLDLQQDPGARPPPLAQGADTVHRQRKDGAQHPGGQCGERPRPDVDGRPREKEEKQAGEQRSEADEPDDHDRDIGQQQIIDGRHGTVPPVQKPGEEDQKRRAEVQGGPQPERDVLVKEPVPVHQRRDAHQRGEAADLDEYTADPMPLPLPLPHHPHEEIRPAQAGRSQHHRGEPGRDPPGEQPCVSSGDGQKYSTTKATSRNGMITSDRIRVAGSTRSRGCASRKRDMPGLSRGRSPRRRTIPSKAAHGQTSDTERARDLQVDVGDGWIHLPGGERGR